MFSNYNPHPAFCLLISLLILHSIISTSSSHHVVYIVYLGHNRLGDPTITSKYHLCLLSKVFASCCSEEDANGAMLYSYKHSFSGFSAKLNASQAMELSQMEVVISVFRSKTLQLHTTRSWDFLGLPLPPPPTRTPLPPQLAYGYDVVVGVFDSGVWPESESFQEAWSMGPVPCSWKGKCVKAYRFDPESACNWKLIGARYYLKGFEAKYGALNVSGSGNPEEFPSPRDFLGHGTHTASTVVGSVVEDVSFLGGGLGRGIARGGAPRARLAVYKVCWGKDYQGKCTEADLMAAFDDALRDGVHVISASLGGTPPLDPFLDSSAGIGSFHAMQQGVSVVFSGGNDGPHPSLVQNVSPWSICVAASTTDRTFPTQIQILLPNRRISITGDSLITESITNAKLADAINYFTDGICERASIRKASKSGAGKVVLCFSTIGPTSIEVAQEAVMTINASALIFAAPPTTQLPDLDLIPTVRLDITRATQIRNVLTELPRLPAVEIGVAKNVIGKSGAPSVAYFSSRGPSSLSPEILKPDISAPGVNILAAWPPETAPTVRPGPKGSGHVKWNFQSGTSMSCPHVSGVVALIKSAHPKWSPAAIRSALITTATRRDSTGDTILAGGSMKASDPFDVGAGQVNPLKALDPGLVYDMTANDYIPFLCSLGYTEHQIRMLLNPSPDQAHTPLCCPSNLVANLNYPSITLTRLHSTTTIKRTLRNVAPNKNAVYFLRVLPPSGVRVVVWPRILFFSCFTQRISYYVTITPLKKSRPRYDFGEIQWSNGFHSVTSPLVVNT
ncbi:subtilisin-like protease SBT3.18 [Momordica charantia]|uniref:Subtilisin-like protease SBT3.18 n=1 Tax=Momordica charantia TaxID=3673 RepID=A0A6J1DLR1_MOMCH|nr:subtilisin-like protease SBT3.18 [Momordica charantia]